MTELPAAHPSAGGFLARKRGVMDQYGQALIGLGIQAGIVADLALCQMFHQAIRRQLIPQCLHSYRGHVIRKNFIRGQF